MESKLHFSTQPLFFQKPKNKFECKFAGLRFLNQHFPLCFESGNERKKSSLKMRLSALNSVRRLKVCRSASIRRCAQEKGPKET